MKTLRRVGAFVRRHKHAEEATVEAAGLDLLWAFLRGAGLFTAGIASAATIASVTSNGPTHHPTFALSSKGAAFIARNEGVRYTPYNDPYNCTVGVGHLIHMGRCSASDLATWKLTPTQATSLLMHDSSTAANAVRSDVTHSINQPQFDALVDFTFNVGTGGLASSSVLRDVNAGAFDAVPDALNLWSYASGTYLPGLHTRRVAEGTLFLKGDYGPQIGLFAPPDPAIAKLKVKTGYWSWLAWKLGEGGWKAYKPAAPSVRPNVPKRIPASWWTRERSYIAHRK